MKEVPLKGVHFVMQVEYDPLDILKPGARLELGEFLTGIRLGAYPVGMRVSKRAQISEYTVELRDDGKLILIDDGGGKWHVMQNGSGHSHGYCMVKHRKRVRKSVKVGVGKV